MKVYCTSLPSRGKLSLENVLNLEPMTFLELTKYSEKVSDMTETERLLFDIERVVEQIPRWEAISFFDLPALIITRKNVSISEKTTILIGDQELDASTIGYKKLTEDVLKIDSIKLGDADFKCSFKTIPYFKKVLEKLISSDRTIPASVAYLVSYLGGKTDRSVVEHVLDAVHEDVTNLNLMSKLIVGYPHVILGGEEVDLMSLTSNLFRSVLQNNGVDETKITFFKTSETPD